LEVTVAAAVCSSEGFGAAGKLLFGRLGASRTTAAISLTIEFSQVGDDLRQVISV
jgi:hypothetical protein